MRTLRLIEIAELLGVSKQRAHQLADESGFPTPVERDGRGRLWSRREVKEWAKAWRRAAGLALGHLGSDAEGTAIPKPLPLGQARHHVPREEREDRHHDDDDRRVLDCRVPH
jgi:predicted DNA-binding transcriptional regulator AlpA